MLRLLPRRIDGGEESRQGGTALDGRLVTERGADRVEVLLQVSTMPTAWGETALAPASTTRSEISEDLLDHERPLRGFPQDGENRP